MVVRDRRKPGLAAALVIVLLAVLLVLAGIWRGWWGFGMAENEADQEVELQVTLDKDRIAEDADATLEKTKEAAQSASVAADVQTVKGRLTALERDRLELEAESGTRSFSLTQATEFLIAGEAGSLERLDLGDPVMVTYRATDDRNFALTVERVD